MSRCPRQKACRVFTTRQHVEKSNTCWTVNSLLKVNMEIMNFRSCSHQNGYETLHGGSLLEIKTSFCAEMNQCQVPLIYHQTCITMSTHAHTHAQVCAQQGARIWLHKICCCHGAALHLLTLPWKHKNDDWHGALSEMGQEHPSQVKSNQIYEHSPASLKNLSGLDSADPDRDQRWKNSSKIQPHCKNSTKYHLIIWLIPLNEEYLTHILQNYGSKTKLEEKPKNVTVRWRTSSQRTRTLESALLDGINLLPAAARTRLNAPELFWLINLLYKKSYRELLLLP